MSVFKIGREIEMFFLIILMKKIILCFIKNIKFIGTQSLYSEYFSIIDSGTHYENPNSKLKFEIMEVQEE